MSETTIRTDETDARADEEHTEQTCPECDGSLQNDPARGETVCGDCGLVVEEESIDRGPEWRAFDAAERDSKSRVGAPTTKLMHDKGLSTDIGWQDKDAYGNSLSSSQRRKVQRMRTWNERFRTRDHKERNLKQALGEVDRMGSALGLPETVRETASVIYRRALDEDLLPGRSIEGVATSALYAAARQHGQPRSIREVAPVSRVDEEEFKRTYRYVNRELKLEVEPADPADYLSRFGSELGLPETTKRLARDLLRAGERQGVASGRSPLGLAAAAVYAAGRLGGEDLTQSDVSEVAEVSEVTIRNRYTELLDAHEAERGGDAGTAAA